MLELCRGKPVPAEAAHFAILGHWGSLFPHVVSRLPNYHLDIENCLLLPSPLRRLRSLAAALRALVGVQRDLDHISSDVYVRWHSLVCTNLSTARETQRCNINTSICCYLTSRKSEEYLGYLS